MGWLKGLIYPGRELAVSIHSREMRPAMLVREEEEKVVVVVLTAFLDPYWQMTALSACFAVPSKPPLVGRVRMIVYASQICQ